MEDAKPSVELDEKDAPIRSNFQLHRTDQSGRQCRRREAAGIEGIVRCSQRGDRQHAKAKQLGYFAERVRGHAIWSEHMRTLPYLLNLSLA